jgi:hypothetical protein
MMRSCVYFFFIFIIPFSGFLKAQNQVSFFEEHIDFSIDDKYFSINGIYSFYNNSYELVNKHIAFPFAGNTSMIDSIRVFDLNKMQFLEFKTREKSISFILTLSPRDTLDINIFYRQYTSNKNTYIITSTQAWGKPLEKAVYTLTTAKDIIIKSFSYNPDTFIYAKGSKVYYWWKYNFMPQIDFDFGVDCGQ